MTTMDPTAPSEDAVTWDDHDSDETYEVVPPDTFDDFDEVDSATVELDDDVDDPQEASD